MVIDFGNKKIETKRVIQVFVSAGALTFALFIAIWIIGFFNERMLNLTVLTNLNTFLTNNWAYIAGFVLFIGLWDYLAPFFKKWTRYGQPLVEAISLVFGLWLVVVFLNGLRFFNANPQVDVVLSFPNELFFSQLVLVVLLFVFVKYSQFFLYENKKYEED